MVVVLGLCEGNAHAALAWWRPRAKTRAADLPWKVRHSLEPPLCCSPHCCALPPPAAAALAQQPACRLRLLPTGNADVAVIHLDAVPEAAASTSCRLSYFAIFDGHGGSNVARHAAENLHSAVLAAGLQQEAERLAGAAAASAGNNSQQSQHPNIKQCKEAITEGFRAFDISVLERCAAAGWPDGCTVVAVWVLADTVLVANCGDARCVLARWPQPSAAEQQPQQSQRQEPQQQEPQQPPPQQPPQQQPLGDVLKAITLTREHKAIFPQERQRVEKAGSFVSADGRLAGGWGGGGRASGRQAWSLR